MRTVAALFVAIALAGCRDDKPIDADAVRITRAFEAYANAPPADRAAALDAFALAHCTRSDDCGDRDACVVYARALADASRLADRARAVGPVDAGGNGAATPAEVATIVAGAEDALKKSESGKPACDAAIGRLYARARGEAR
jgi:hypothetical protein